MTHNLVNEVAEALRSAYEFDPRGAVPLELLTYARNINEMEGFTLEWGSVMDSIVRTENMHLTEDELWQAVNRACQLDEVDA